MKTLTKQQRKAMLEIKGCGTMSSNNARLRGHLLKRKLIQEVFRNYSGILMQSYRVTGYGELALELDAASFKPKRMDFSGDNIKNA